MAYYGILKSSDNSGAESELVCKFAAPLTVNSTRSRDGADTLSLKRRATARIAQRWEVTAAIAQGTDAGVFMSHVVSNDVDTVMYIRIPQLTGVELVDGLNVQIDVPSNSRSSIVTLKGLEGNIVPSGMFISFADESKIYQVIKSTAWSKYEIFPPLIKAKATDTKMLYGPMVTMPVYLELDSVIGISYADGILTDPGTYKFVEAL